MSLAAVIRRDKSRLLGARAGQRMEFCDKVELGPVRGLARMVDLGVVRWRNVGGGTLACRASVGGMRDKLSVCRRWLANDNAQGVPLLRTKGATYLMEVVGSSDVI